MEKQQDTSDIHDGRQDNVLDPGSDQGKEKNPPVVGQSTFIPEQETQMKSWMMSALVEALVKASQSSSNSSLPPSSQNTTQLAGVNGK